MPGVNYWTCQIAGWLLLALANTPLGASIPAGSGRVFTANLIQCTLGLLLTHAFRIVARRWRWTRLPLRSLIPAIILATFTVAIIWHLLLLAILDAIHPALPYPRVLLDIAFGTAFGESAVVLVWSLIYFGYHFFQNYKRAEIEGLRLESAVKDAELRALKAQMNPHFIFNALNGIRALVAEDPARAQEMITRLAGIMRHTFRSGNMQVMALEAELAVIADYLALESLRFEERLAVTLDIDPDSLPAMIPAMLLQTLVENGVKYGAARLPGGGELTLRSEVRDDMLHVRVINSGQLDPAPGGDGVGLRNARERLHLLFDDAASLHLFNIDAAHVAADLTLPLQYGIDSRADHRRRAAGTHRAAPAAEGIP